MSTEQRAPLPSDPSRRDFFKIGLVASAGLTVAALIPSALAAQGEPSKSAPVFEPNAFVRISEDNTVTVMCKHTEMGQGTYTGLATLVDK